MPDNRRELIKYRLESARERLNSAEVLLASKSYKDSIGRSYYAMFTAVRALLAKDGVDYSKHAGVISYFQREYIKTQKFEKKYSKYLCCRGCGSPPRTGGCARRPGCPGHPLRS